MLSSWGFARSMCGRSKKGIEDVGICGTNVTYYE